MSHFALGRGNEARGRNREERELGGRGRKRGRGSWNRAADWLRPALQTLANFPPFLSILIMIIITVCFMS